MNQLNPLMYVTPSLEGAPSDAYVILENPEVEDGLSANFYSTYGVIGEEASDFNNKCTKLHDKGLFREEGEESFVCGMEVVEGESTEPFSVGCATACPGSELLGKLERLHATPASYVMTKSGRRLSSLAIQSQPQE